MRLRTVARLALGPLALSLLARDAFAKETVLDDFEAPNAIAEWTFYDGAEFPGATGSLAAGAGHSGSGAVLSYDLGNGGHYVSASRKLAAPVTAAGVAFWAKVPAGMHAKLRVTDTSGQTLQYDLNRPLQAFDAGAWFRQVVDLAAPSSHYGGANDGAVHQPITTVTVLAADPDEPGAKGSLSFDDVVAIDALSARIDPRTPPSAPAPAGVPELASHLGVNIHFFTNDDRALDLAEQAGFSFVRMDFGWSDVERTKGQYDLAGIDALVASLAKRGMGLLLILDYFNPLYPAADSADFTGTTVPAFAAMSKAAAQHFAGKNVRFEVWNEPNLDNFWPPKANPSQYGALCKAGIAAVHQGNAAAKVSTGGLSQFDTSFLRGFLAPGGGTDANAVGVHPYRQGAPESVADSTILLRSIIASLPSKPSAWSTEWGYSSTWYGDGHAAATRATQAKFAVREILSSWAVGFPVIVYYDVRDDGADPTNAEHNFGLLANDYSPKPAYTAVRTLSDFVKGRTFTGFFDTAPSSLHALGVTAPGSAGAIVWVDAPGGAVDVTVPSGTTAMGMQGNPLSPAVSGADATLHVREADGPVYLSIPVAAVADAGADGAAGTGSGGAPAASGGASSSGGATSAGFAGTSSTGTASNGSGGTSATGGVTSTASAPDGGTGSSRSSSGCGCSVPASTEPRDAWLLVALAAAALGRRRKA